MDKPNFDQPPTYTWNQTVEGQTIFFWRILPDYRRNHPIIGETIQISEKLRLTDRSNFNQPPTYTSNQTVDRQTEFQGTTGLHVELDG